METYKVGIVLCNGGFFEIDCKDLDEAEKKVKELNKKGYYYGNEIDYVYIEEPE